MTSRATSKRPAAPLPKLLELRVGDARDALDRFEAAWNRRTEGRTPLYVLSVADLPLLLRTLTPARWQLLERLREAGPLSIYELAKRLGRDYKNVHTDVSRMSEAGLIDKDADGRVRVPWDVVRGEF
jgi:predicted transcriptional regulator